MGFYPAARTTLPLDRRITHTPAASMAARLYMLSLLCLYTPFTVYYFEVYYTVLYYVQ